MSKSITIPTNWGSRIIIVINNKTYTYDAGETVSVPDEVAAAIANALANNPKGTRKSAIDDAINREGVLYNYLDARVTALEQGGGGGVLVVSIVEDGETLRLDKTAGEIWAAIESSSILLKDVVEGVYNYIALATAGLTEGTYSFTFSEDAYEASSADSYPVLGGR